MKTKITLIVAAMFISFGANAQNFGSSNITNNAFHLSAWGDLKMRRFAANDTQWKRALVPFTTQLRINYGGDFTSGTRVMGSILKVDGNLQVDGTIGLFNGSVGIGTTNITGWKLAVNGKIRAKEIKVETGWSDFVFENMYALPTLTEVEQHIKEKGHLKDIPSAAEVAKNGILLGEMNAKLLQKIEELTLYMIEQEKQLTELKEKVGQLENQQTK